jgi:hypothetical protein
MTLVTTRCGLASIAASGTTSNAIEIGNRQQAARSLTIESPSALTTAVTVHCSTDGGLTYKALYQGAADVTIPANKVFDFAYPAGVTHLKLIAAGAEAAQRDFTVFTVHDI